MTTQPTTAQVDISVKAVEQLAAFHDGERGLLISASSRQLTAAKLRALRSALTASEKLAAYGSAILAASREEFGDLDGGFLQDKAAELGVLVEIQVTEACAEEGCHCAEYGDFPQNCFRYPPEVEAILAKGETK